MRRYLGMSINFWIALGYCMTPILLALIIIGAFGRM